MSQCYQGEWPVQDCITFPIYWVTAYLRPMRPMGDSDTTRQWDQQMAYDQFMTKAYNDMMRTQTIVVLPQVGLYDAEGHRFEMTDGQDNVAFADQSDLQGPEPMVQAVPISSLDPAWGVYMNALSTALTQFRGITDFGLTPESTKDIPVGTAQALERQGEIPVAEFMKREKRAAGIAATLTYQYRVQDGHGRSDVADEVSGPGHRDAGAAGLDAAALVLGQRSRGLQGRGRGEAAGDAGDLPDRARRPRCARPVRGSEQVAAGRRARGRGVRGQGAGSGATKSSRLQLAAAGGPDRNRAAARGHEPGRSRAVCRRAAARIWAHHRKRIKRHRAAL